MSGEYGDWPDWLLCVCLAIMLFVGVFVRKFVERIRRLFGSLSPLRKVFGVLSLIAIPYMVSVGFGEQAASPMNPHETILWFTAAAVNAIVLFWVCEELITTSPPLRILFLVALGIIVVLALHHQLAWAMSVAEDAATADEIKESHECANEVRTRRLYFTVVAPKSALPEVPKSKPREEKPSQSPVQLKRPNEEPVQLSAAFYNPTEPGIVISNSADRVAEGVVWSMVAFRKSDLSYFGFATQSVGYIKAHAETLPYSLNLQQIQKSSDGNGQIMDGDELTGSISVDCPTCKLQTYMVHFIWGHSGWFFESPQKGGYIVPKDMSKEGRAQYIQLFTSDTFAKDRIEIRPRPQ